MYAYLVSAVRTPIGALNGALADVSATQLGSLCTTAALERSGLTGDDVDEVLFGNVVSAGLGQNPARQVALGAKLPVSVGATTVNKVCGSGLKAVMLAAQAIRLNDARVVVAGGMESMSRAPYLLTKARQGYRFGHGELLDAMLLDGLWDCYGQQPMGVFGDRCAVHCGLSREEQDDFAIRSFQRARAAAESGAFRAEIVPVPVTSRKQTVLVAEDEGPGRFDESKLRRLPPAFGEGGTVTAGNASSLNDGAAAVVLVSGELLHDRGLRPRARIVGASTHSREPEWFTLAPIEAIRRVVRRAGWTVDDVDLFEINEAFACVVLAAERELSIPAEKSNLFGGAIALGHPIGCSGARILVTLLHGLERTGGRRGVACLCVGGGEAVAIAIERH